MDVRFIPKSGQMKHTKVRVFLKSTILDNRRKLIVIANQNYAFEAVTILLVHVLQKHSDFKKFRRVLQK